MVVIAEIPESPPSRLANTLSHPVRIEALRHMSESACSSNEIAQRMRRSVSDVAYHVRQLHKAGCIREVGSRKVRGSVETFYEANVQPRIDQEEWENLSDHERQGLSSVTLQNMFGEAFAAVSDGSMDRRMERNLTWRHLPLDQEGWGELTDMLLEVMQRTDGIYARSQRRLKESGESPMSAVLALMAFERAGLPSAP